MFENPTKFWFDPEHFAGGLFDGIDHVMLSTEAEVEYWLEEILETKAEDLAVITFEAEDKPEDLDIEPKFTIFKTETTGILTRVGWTDSKREEW